MAHLVGNQQELVDQLADNLDNSKNNTRSGLGYLQNPKGGKREVSANATTSATIPTLKRTNQKSKSKLRVNEDFKWTMPFETISDDVLDVQKDIIKVMNVAKSILDGMQDSIQKSTSKGTKEQVVIGCYTSAFDCSNLPELSVKKTETSKKASRVAILQLNSL